MALVEMRIALITTDPQLGTHVVILEPREGTGRAVPIWIGQPEALAIVAAVQSIRMARPMTHDLFKAALDDLGAKVEAVDVVALRDGTYYAAVRLSTPAGPKTLDARPSDALALAVRAGAPIRVEEEVIAAAASATMTLKSSEDASPLVVAGDVTDDLLASLTEDAFPKWKM